MLPVAVDAMGGDHAPAIVAGALLAAESGIPVALVGPADLPSRVDTGSLPLIEASEVIEMDEDPAHGVRRKKIPPWCAPLRQCAMVLHQQWCPQGIQVPRWPQGFFAWVVFGELVDRRSRDDSVPGGTPTVLLDAGANSEVQADWLVQFAQMGSIFAEHRLGIANPQVGLLSIGEEAGKGDSLVKRHLDC